jgi:DegV family protein with EDD domain
LQIHSDVNPAVKFNHKTQSVYPESNRMKIALVTDSACDIPYEMAHAFQIKVVPNILVIEGKSVEDNEEFSRREFYKQLPDMVTFPTTSTASVGKYQTLYQELIDSGFDQIISIHVSHHLSGIYNAASTAAQSFTGQVHVVDGLQVSLGLGFQVLEAAEAVADGASLDSVLAILKQIQGQVRLIAMLDTLEYIRRSGRVSWARASLGALLNLKPFIEVKDGSAISLGEVRTRKKGIARLEKLMQSSRPLKRFAILHTNAEDDARRILETFAPEMPTPPLLVNVTTVIGAHVGPNGLGFVALYQN